MTFRPAFGIARDEQPAQLLFDAPDVQLRLGHLGLGQLAFLAGRVGDHLAGGIEVGPGPLQPVPCGDDLLELSVASPTSRRRRGSDERSGRSAQRGPGSYSDSSSVRRSWNWSSNTGQG